MSNQQILGYLPNTTIIHRLSGAAKLVALILISIATMTTYDTRFLLAMSLFSVVLFKVSQIKWRVLLLETRYKHDWELPGGVIEPGEPPRRGAAREITEELGIEVEIGQPALVDWMPEYLGWSDAIEFIFDLGVLDDSRRAAMRPGAEIRALHWVDPADVGRRVTELSQRRIGLLIRGYRGHTEAGYPAGAG